MSFRAADGATLKGSFFRHLGDGPPREAVLICAATGLSERLYRPFAAFLAERGCDVLTFDYRGLGRSLAEAHARESKARKRDWGSLDMPAALSFLLEESGASRAVLVGNSAGGNLVGLMPNHAALSRVVSVAGSSGHVGGMPFPARFFAWFMLAVFMPLAVRLSGYVPGKRFRLGEDIPPGVAAEWSRWCLRPGYLARDLGGAIPRHFYAEFSSPITLFRPLDDPFTSPANVAEIRRVFPRAEMEVRELDPRALGVRRIGHVDLFRPENAPAWEVVAEAIFGGRSSAAAEATAPRAASA